MRTEAKPVLSGQRLKWTLEQIAVEDQQRVRVDWLRFTVPLSAVISRDPSLVDLDVLDLLDQPGRDLVRQANTVDLGEYTSARRVAAAGARHMAELLACGIFAGEAEARGMDFYTGRCPLVFEGETVGFVLAGGKSNNQAATVHVNLFGSAFLHIRRAHLAKVREYVAANHGVITRVDLAVDAWAGHSVESVQSAYLAGEFDYRGKRPGQQNAGSWALGHSRTFSVGSRATGKLLRAYEKGDEQFGSRELSAQHQCAEWVRYEVELRNNHRVIDLDVLTRPADFFAGAYGFCAELLDRLGVESQAQAIKTNPEIADKTADAAVARVVRWVKRTAAPAIAMVLEQGGDLLGEIVFAERHRVPKRLTGIAPKQLQASFEKVAQLFAPACAPSMNGAFA